MRQLNGVRMASKRRSHATTQRRNAKETNACVPTPNYDGMNIASRKHNPLPLTLRRSVRKNPSSLRGSFDNLAVTNTRVVGWDIVRQENLKPFLSQ